eukprot:m.101907 g.101907  ORF g.101907 m.101907 type:complete len:319 (+) comp20780_c1_seq3:96-1052(+)
MAAFVRKVARRLSSFALTSAHKLGLGTMVRQDDATARTLRLFCLVVCSLPMCACHQPCVQCGNGNYTCDNTPPSAACVQTATEAVNSNNYNSCNYTLHYRPCDDATAATLATCCTNLTLCAPDEYVSVEATETSDRTCRALSDTVTLPRQVPPGSMTTHTSTATATTPQQTVDPSPSENSTLPTATMATTTTTKLETSSTEQPSTHQRNALPTTSISQDSGDAGTPSASITIERIVGVTIAAFVVLFLVGMVVLHRLRREVDVVELGVEGGSCSRQPLCASASVSLSGSRRNSRGSRPGSGTFSRHIYEDDVNDDALL